MASIESRTQAPSASCRHDFQPRLGYCRHCGQPDELLTLAYARLRMERVHVQSILDGPRATVVS